MKIIVVSCLAVLFHFTEAFAEVNEVVADGDDELVSVVMLFRDGDKAPTSSFPKDPYFDPSYWPMGFGQLTNMGVTRHYDLGQWIRARYPAFLPAGYNSKDVYVRSTDIDRALMSAAANVAGIFPPATSQVWNSDLKWRPVPIHTIPEEDDQTLYMNSDCAKFYDLYEDQLQSDYFKKINEKYSDFYKEVSTLTGWNITDIELFGKLQSVFDAYASYDLSYLPSWYSILDKDKLNYLSSLSYARYTYTDGLKRLGAGPFFNYLLSHFEAAVTDAASAPKLLLLSGHESTLIAALNTLSIFDFEPTAFAAAIVWELRKTEDGTHVVSMFYKKNSAQDVPNELQLGDCGFDCNYDSYKSILEPYAVDMASWKVECEA